MKQQGYATSDLAARVAAVTAAYELGKLAGCIPGGASAASADRAAAGLRIMGCCSPNVQLSLLAMLQGALLRLACVQVLWGALCGRASRLKPWARNLRAQGDTW